MGIPSKRTSLWVQRLANVEAYFSLRRRVIRTETNERWSGLQSENVVLHIY